MKPQLLFFSLLLLSATFLLSINAQDTILDLNPSSKFNYQIPTTHPQYLQSIQNSTIHNPLQEPQPVPQLVYLSKVSDSFCRRSSLVFAIHSISIRCIAKKECPRCWTIDYRPPEAATYKPRSVAIAAHNLRGQEAKISDFFPEIVDWYLELDLNEESDYVMGIQIMSRMGPEYPHDQDHTASIHISAVKCRPSPEPPTEFTQTEKEEQQQRNVDNYKLATSIESFENDLDFAVPQARKFAPVQEKDEPIPGFDLTQVLVAPSIDSAKRAEVSTYFYNTYIPGLDPRSASPKGMDSKRAHAELQISAWYNFELIPRPSHSQLPTSLELHLHGRSYFVINETYSTQISQTLCWINSLPAVVRIEPVLNQTIYIQLLPRFDMHNPQSTLKEPIPVASANIDPMQARFFFEFTCQDRLKIVYDPADLQHEYLAIVPVRTDPQNGAETRFVDRYITDLTHVPGFSHTSTPNEILGRAFYDSTRNLILCRTTIDFWDTRWLDESTEVRIIGGVDGLTYQYDQPDESPASSVMLAILPDSNHYPDIDPEFDEDMLNPRMFIGNVSHTGAGGPFVTFFLQDGIRPYTDDIKTPSSSVQINIVFQLRNAKLNYPSPSCTIVVEGMQFEGKSLSYSTSQYLNTTEFYRQTHPEEEQNYNQQEFKQPFLAESGLKLHNPDDESTQQHDPSGITQQHDPSGMNTLGYKYPEALHSASGMIVSSNPFDSISIDITNAKRTPFSYVAVNTQPGLTRFKFKDQNFTTNGEQFLSQCYASSGSNSIEIQGALSVLTRELQIGPIPSNFVQKHTEIHISCKNIKLVNEPIHFINEYDYIEFEIRRNDYPLSSVRNRLKLKPLQHFITLFFVFDVHATQPLHVYSGNFSDLPVPDSSSLPYRTIHSEDEEEEVQIYLTKVSSFAIDEPDKSYRWETVGIIIGSIAALLLLLSIFPVYRLYHDRRDKKRRHNISIQETSMVSIPFEELTD